MATSSQITISISGLEQEIHRLVNQERKQYGIIQLAWEPKLSDIARAHSQDMAGRDFFSHQTPEGRSAIDRGATGGYNCRKDYGGYYTEGLAENIFKSHLYRSIAYYNGVPSYNWMNQSEIAQAAVSGWMSSPGHRKNILTATYDKQGIGVAVSLERNEVYVTQNFC